MPIKGKALLLAKIETTYGTDAAPVPANNSILSEWPEVEPVVTSLERSNTRAFLGAFPKLNVGEAIKIKFTTEIKGSGTAATPPEVGPLFKACGFTETISSTVVYAPNSNILTTDSVTIWFYFDGMAHKITGCRGTFDIDVKAGQYGKINWEFTGLYKKAEDLALTTGTYQSTIPPRFLSATLALDSYAAIVENFKVSIGNEIAKRVDANAATGILAYFIKGRNVTGELDPELVTIAIKDFWAMQENSSQVAFTAAVGSVAGNRLIIAGPNVQISGIKYGDRENLMTYQLPLVFVPGATGNNEISLSYT
jgi:hypothetical protein